MDEYIEREAATNVACNILWKMNDLSTSVMAKALNSIPAADVAPVVHGQWETNSDRPDSLICSVCKCGFDMWKHDPHNFCPNCGAKMDGGDGDADD